MIVKRGHKASNSRMVKRNKTTKVVISILLAIAGIVISVMAYQYTYSAKLEQELNNKANVIEQKSTEIQKQSETLNLTETQKQELQKQVDELNKQKEELNKQLQAKQAEKARVAQIQAAQAQSAPKVVSYTTPTTQVSSGGCEGLRAKMSSLGVSGANLDAAITLAKRESSCNEFAVNSSSNACGAYQSLPCGKWGAPGTTEYYLGAINYVNSRYGSYVNALAHSYSAGWY